MRNVIRLAKLEKANKFTIFIAKEWTYELFNLLSQELKVTRNIGEIMRKVLALEEMKMKGKNISKLVLSIAKDPSKIPKMITSAEEEYQTMLDAKEFLEKEFSCEIKIIPKSDHLKASSAMPGKVGILVE